MNYKCVFCKALFEQAKDSIEHLQIIHSIKEGKQEFPCLVNNECCKKYLTIKGLKNHMKKCEP